MTEFIAGVITGVFISALTIVIIAIIIFFKRGVLNFDDPIYTGEIKYDCESTTKKI